MNSSKKTILALSIITLTAIVIYFTTSVTATEKPSHPTPDLKPELGIISYPANAPQLSSIKVDAVTEVSLPIADAMNGKLAYRQFHVQKRPNV